jgi:hypothetical protein
MLAVASVAKQRFDAVQELLLPLTDLDRVNLIPPGQLGKGPGLFGGLQRDPSLEGRGISLSCARHDAPRNGTVIFDQFNIPSGPVLGVHLIPVSLARRSRANLKLYGSKVRNEGSRSAAVEYLQVGRDQILKPRSGNAVVLKPGESAPLSDFDLPPDTDSTTVTIPPEAVTVEVGPDPFEDFQRDPGLLETVTVRNLLPAHDDVRKTDLRFVEVRVVQAVGEGADAVESSAGPYRLAPKDADGAEVAVPFLKPGTKPRKYRLEGTAYYQGGGDGKKVPRDVLKPTTTEGTSFDITDALLPGR